MTLEEVPESFKGDKGFATYFDACERACFSREDDAKYTQDMMNEWDIQNAKDLAVREGRAEGRAEGKAEGRAEVEKKDVKKGWRQGARKALRLQRRRCYNPELTLMLSPVVLD